MEDEINILGEFTAEEVTIIQPPQGSDNPPPPAPR